MARLTEQEQQEIIRFIEADKPLPDKYRFLLFDEKREVELVWNGKTGEVCNVVLPFQTIEQVDEPRAEKPEDSPLQSEGKRQLFRRPSFSPSPRRVPSKVASVGRRTRCLRYPPTVIIEFKLAPRTNLQRRRNIRWSLPFGKKGTAV